MKITQITAWDLIGERFAGLQLHHRLLERGHDAHLALHQPFAALGRGVHLVGTPFTRWFDRTCAVKAESVCGVRSWLTVSAFATMFSKYVRKAQVVHLHLIHALPFFNLLCVYLLARRHPVIWSLHDPWMQTGHCVYPLKCDRWQVGCGHCPRLEIPFAQQRDTTALQWRLKRMLMRHSRLTLVVASEWMRDMVRRSPILQKHPCHVIPYGLDLTVFAPRPRQDARRQFGVPEGHAVFAFRYRGEGDFFKGGDTLKRALLRLTDKRVTLLVFEGRGGLDDLAPHFNIVYLGWVRNAEVAAAAYSAADVFVMPSQAEAFGMMAVEAMACGTPVVGTMETALPEVIKPPQGGVVVPAEDEVALAGALRRLLEEPGERMALSVSSRALASREYDVKTYVDAHLRLYEAEVASWESATKCNARESRCES